MAEQLAARDSDVYLTMRLNSTMREEDFHCQECIGGKQWLLTDNPLSVLPGIRRTLKNTSSPCLNRQPISPADAAHAADRNERQFKWSLNDFMPCRVIMASSVQAIYTNRMQQQSAASTTAAWNASSQPEGKVFHHGLKINR